MAVELDEALIDHILTNRPPHPDAHDLLAIRDAIASLEDEIADLKGRRLAWVNKKKIAALEAELSRYQLAEITAREHVRASPEKSKVLESETRHREEKAAQQPPREQADRPVPVPSRRPPEFDKAAFVERQQTARKRVRVRGGADDDDE